MALDSFNRPHIVFYADDANGIPQYQHLRFDGKVWHHAIVSQRAADFELLGAGTLQIPISRPEIVLDAQDNAYLIYRGDLSKDRMTAIYSKKLQLVPTVRIKLQSLFIIFTQKYGKK